VEVVILQIFNCFAFPVIEVNRIVALVKFIEGELVQIVAKMNQAKNRLVLQLSVQVLRKKEQDVKIERQIRTAVVICIRNSQTISDNEKNTFIRNRF
jgi:hypothetical protein